jgi:hypothetical protein
LAVVNNDDKHTSSLIDGNGNAVVSLKGGRISQHSKNWALIYDANESLYFFNFTSRKTLQKPWFRSISSAGLFYEGRASVNFNQNVYDKIRERIKPCYGIFR